MKCQILLLGKIRKTLPIYCLLNISPESGKRKIHPGLLSTMAEFENFSMSSADML